MLFCFLIFSFFASLWSSCELRSTWNTNSTCKTSDSTASKVRWLKWRNHWFRCSYGSSRLLRAKSGWSSCNSSGSCASFSDSMNWQSSGEMSCWGTALVSRRCVSTIKQKARLQLSSGGYSLAHLVVKPSLSLPASCASSLAGVGSTKVCMSAQKSGSHTANRSVGFLYFAL